MSNPSEPNPFIQSDVFIPESEPGKGDGVGWRLNKDGTLEISRASIVDATIKSLPLGYFIQPTLNGLLGRIPNDRKIASSVVTELQTEATVRAEADEALASRIGTATLRVETPGGDVTLGDLERETIVDNDKVKLYRYSSEKAAQLGNATESLDRLVSHHSRLMDEVYNLEGDESLRNLARQHFITGVALLRELLRKVDTRDVDDGK